DRFQVLGMHFGLYGRHDLAGGDVRFGTEVEAFADDARFADLLGQRQIGVDGVFNVDIVADHAAVATKHGPLSFGDRANGAGHDPAEVQVAAAVDIAAPRDRNRQ